MPSNLIETYLASVAQSYKRGDATEHSYRAHLQRLIEEQTAGIKATNEPKRQECGAPDYVLYRGVVPVGYIETKDLSTRLAEVSKSEQLQRYRSSLDNLILTNYLTFTRYRYGKQVQEISIADIQNGRIVPNPDAFDLFRTMIDDFCNFRGQTIKSANQLATIMAQKTRFMKEVLLRATRSAGDENTLRDQLQVFKEILIHDIDEEGFADMYAQTIAYGLFAARLHDTTMDDFSRQEAQTLLPKSNPFLKNLFGYVSGVDLDDRVVWIIDDLCAVFQATDVASILSEYRKYSNTGRNIDKGDPYIHFYETFLTEYNPALRKQSGVYYTPDPVVRFIVQAVDDVLKTDFGLAEGLADTETITHTVSKDGKAAEKEVHRMQILDPAAGTGTFLAEIIRNIRARFEGQEGSWSSYVDRHLIPRMNGFEILMASYAMCHLKLELLLRETEYTAQADKQARFRVYLTNTLEESDPPARNLFASWLTKEAQAAGEVKNDTPIMVVMGNPPYSGESQNKSDYIMSLMEAYKKEPGGADKLDEKNPKWINDDYVKFIRFGEHFITQTGEGILAYINNHSFLDNPTFRGMRWHLLRSFDIIYIIDLHGNSKKKETAPDGSVDKNVFDIQQGVSINLFIKTGKKKKDALAEVRHYDLYGTRDYKYHFLYNNTLSSIPFKTLPNRAPQYFMVPKDFRTKTQYDMGFTITDIFTKHTTGIVTARDSICIDMGRKILTNRIHKICDTNLNTQQLRYELFPSKNNGEHLAGDTNAWKLEEARVKIRKNDHAKIIQHISYRPFDTRYIYYSPDMVDRGREEIMRHFLAGENVGLVFKIGNPETNSVSAHVTKHIIDFRSWSRPGMQGGDYAAPLYRYPGQEELDDDSTRTPNLNTKMVGKIAQALKLTFTKEKESDSNTFAPIDILDYIYAVLHSPSYRKKYQELLKIDFPRVPCPTAKKVFWQLVAQGKALRVIHLLEDPNIAQFKTSFPVSGDNIVHLEPHYTDGSVFINDTQYFGAVPAIAWNFYIGGYQPAQKWLKDRKQRALSFDDITHYQKIIRALTETDRIMREIDAIGVEW